MNEAIDYSTVKWVKQELDTTLKQARQALEAHVENPADESQLRFCAVHLHQVHGTLQMVELYGAALLAEEMEQVVDALLANTVGQKQEAYELIMRAILQLPDYLERLVSGGRDQPLALLPLLNDLRAIRGQKLLSENSLFSPDLTVALPAAALVAHSGEDLQTLARKQRHTYQLALLGWFRGKDVTTNLGRLADALGHVQAVCVQDEAQRFWWIAGGLAVALREDWLETSMSTKLLLGQVDRQIKRIIDEGEDALVSAPPNDLLKNLLFYVGRAQDAGEPVSLIKQTYRLSTLLPDRAELEHAQDSMSGHNTELMRTVSSAIKEDLAHVKEALDLFLRGGRKAVADLQPAAETLNRVADTLGMLGLGALRKLAQSQAQSSADIVEGRRQPEESALMEIASALLYVESSLEGLVQGTAPAQESAADEQTGGMMLPDAEFNQVRGVVANEAIRDIAQTKDAIMAFMENSEDFAVLERVPQLFNQIKGGLLLLNEQCAAELIDAVRGYVADRILVNREVPPDTSLDDLADAISSIEYYLENLREGRVFGGSILDVAAKSLARLGYELNIERAPATEPLGESFAPEMDTADEGVDAAEGLSAGLDDAFFIEVTDIDMPVIGMDVQDLEAPDPFLMAESDANETQDFSVENIDRSAGMAGEMGDVFSSDAFSEDSVVELPTDSIEIVREPAVTAAEASAPVVPSMHMVMSEDIDEEILEIFLEESDEELVNINQNLPNWIANEEDRESLVVIRRSFHTLKGSGRLVGALRIGEFAWGFESMLNRYIDGTITRSDTLCNLLERAAQALPELIEQIRSSAPTSLPIEAMVEMAHAVSRGEAVSLSDLDAVVASTTILAESSAPAEDELSAVNESVASEDLVSGVDDLQLSAEIDAFDPFTLRHDSGTDNELAEAASDDGFDPVLYDIFSNESHDHISTIKSFLGNCHVQAMECRITEELMRALHTLHGSARMAGATEIADIACEIERYGKALRNDGLPMPEEGMALMSQSLEVIADLLPLLRSSAKAPATHLELVEAIARLPRTTENVEHIPSAEIPEDDEIELSVRLEDGALSLSASDIEDPFASFDEQLESAEPESMLGADAVSLNADLFAETDYEVEVVDLSATDQADPFAETAVDEAIEITSGADELAINDGVDPFAAAELDEIDTFAVETPVEPTDNIEEISLDVSNEEDAFADSLDQVESAELSVEAPEQSMPMPSASVEQPAMAACEWESIDYNGVDADLLDVFLEEGDEIMVAIDATLHNWVNAPDDTALMAELQRHLHTLKGGARMANISSIGDLSHSLESLFIAVVDGLVAPSRSLFDILLVAQDRLSHMLEAARAQRPMRSATALIEQLEAVRRGEAIPVAEQVDASPAIADAPQQETTMAASAVARAAEPDAVAAFEDAKLTGRVQQELVRVRADLLDNMVNFAGEISIYRSRLEQQIGSARFNLTELGQTVSRLREQLRMLEIETEAQVLFRYEREGADGDDHFDPLEMDRYSHLQQLSRSMLEGIGDLVSIQGLLDNITRESETLLLQQARVNTELQEGLMRTRMVPFSGLSPRMRRIVRQACQELGKRAELTLEGAEGEMDRTVIDRIIAPIEHMLRNAIAHGIETPDQRKAAGKRGAGNIKVSLSRDGSEVVIKMSDDGAGMNIAAIRRKARERGLITDDAEINDNDAMQFVLETGFSTAEKVSQISGRGVGMDVVNSEVKQLGGSLHIDSIEGQGTTFTIRLPFTLAISQALLVQVHEEIYAIPLTGIEGIARLHQDELAGYINDSASRYEYAGNSYPVQNLGAMLGHGQPVLGAGAPKRLPVLLVRSGEHRMALQVESLLGSRETVVKSVGPQISTVRGISGATILGDGRVVLILDLGGLLRSGGMALGVDRAAPVAEREVSRTMTVMVVDDSITVRKVTTRLLERNDMQVITAKDGVDAVAKLQEHIPDMMLLDIEMPRMDGFELATHIRNEARLRGIPIIMITSRTGDKHRKRAMEIGVDRYLGKPFQETELLATIRELSEERRTNG